MPKRGGKLRLYALHETQPEGRSDKYSEIDSRVTQQALLISPSTEKLLGSLNMQKDIINFLTKFPNFIPWLRKQKINYTFTRVKRNQSLNFTELIV